MTKSDEHRLTRLEILMALHTVLLVKIAGGFGALFEILK